MVVCGRIECVGGVRGSVGVSTSVESEQTVSNTSCLNDIVRLEAICTERCFANFLACQCPGVSKADRAPRTLMRISISASSSPDVPEAITQLLY